MLLVLAACGDGSSGTTTPALPSLNEQAAPSESDSTTTTTEAVDPDQAMQEYAECMREHGIDMPDPGSGGGVIEMGVDEEGGIEAFEEAGEACDPILEAAFGEFELSPEQEAEFMDEQLAFAQCMRDNGVDWPDPDPNGDSTIALELGSDVDPDTIDAAMETCGEGLFGGGGVTFGASGEGSTP